MYQGWKLKKGPFSYMPNFLWSDCSFLVSAGVLLKGGALTFHTFGGPRDVCTKAAAFTDMCFVTAAGLRATNGFSNEA